MKREENESQKEAYITPAIEKVAIDNEISVVLMSGSGLQPRP
jgi:hypothetical protein